MTWLSCFSDSACTSGHPMCKYHTNEHVIILQRFKVVSITVMPVLPPNLCLSDPVIFCHLRNFLQFRTAPVINF